MSKDGRIQRVKIHGRVWRWRYVHGLSNRGDCDAPDTKNKAIRIGATLHGEERLEIELHEIIHAGMWYIDEPIVADVARDVARVLWRLGYRLPAE